MRGRIHFHARDAGSLRDLHPEPSRRGPIPGLAVLLGVAAATLACVFGFRSEVEFIDEAELAGVDTVQLELPATELTITGVPGRDSIRWTGRWLTLGGSSDDALRGAREAALVWESWESIGRLHADLPIAIRDLTTLEFLDVRTASDVAHEIVGAGDVDISDIDAYVSVELTGGDVRITGGLEQLRVHTERGDIEVDTVAAVDLFCGVGSVRVASEAGGAVLIDANGPVVVELAELANLDLDIADAGQIVVQLGEIAHVGSGSYRRTIAAGTRTIRVRANGGRVDLREL